MSYDNPTVSEFTPSEVGGGATTEYAKFRQFCAAKLKKVTATITTAGTVTTAGFDVYHGTTSIGTILLGTNTAKSNPVDQTVYSSAILNRQLASGDQISVKSLADATSKAIINYVFEMNNDIN